MALMAVDVFDRQVVIDAPSPLLDDLAAFFPSARIVPEAERVDLALREPERDNWVIEGADGAQTTTSASVLLDLHTAICRLAANSREVTFAAPALGFDGNAVLLLCPEAPTGPLLTAWGIDRGFSYLAGSAVQLERTQGNLLGFAGPLVMPQAQAAAIGAMALFRDVAAVASGDAMIAFPETGWLSPDPAAAPCRLVIIARFVPGSVFSIRAASPGFMRAQAERLVLRSGGASAEDLAAITSLSSTLPALYVSFSAVEQCTGPLDRLIRYVLATAVSRLDLERLLEALTPRPPAAFTYPVQAASPALPPRKLTIGMATYDVYDGAYFSVQALRLYHSEVMDEVELLIVDNHPDGPAAQPLKALDQFAKNLRYVPFGERSGSAPAKNRVFEAATGEFVLCIDSHVLIQPGAIRRLLDYFESHPNTPDLLQGPIVFEDLESIATHWKPGWSNGMPGTWAIAERDFDREGEPFTIPMQGMGLFACRRAAWPGFNPKFQGFGGEEGYMHEKFRRSGAQTWCLPFLGWVHRFARPLGVPHAPIGREVIRNQLIGMRELSLPTDEMVAHMREFIGKEAIDEIVGQVEVELRVQT